MNERASEREKAQSRAYQTNERTEYEREKKSAAAATENEKRVFVVEIKRQQSTCLHITRIRELISQWIFLSVSWFTATCIHNVVLPEHNTYVCLCLCVSHCVRCVLCSTVVWLLFFPHRVRWFIHSSLIIGSMCTCVLWLTYFTLAQSQPVVRSMQYEQR